MVWKAVALVIEAAAAAAAPGDSTSFYAQRENEIRTEYAWCTGDTASQPLDSVIRWKNALNDFINSPTYPSWRKRYIDMTGIRSNVVPCEVQGWAAQQVAAARLEERRAELILGMRADQVEESTAVARELRQNPKTPFDFARIPFGVSRRVFASLFREIYPSNELEDRGESMVSELVSWGGGLFTLVFFFDNAGSLYRYEVQSASYPGDSLDGVVRPLAEQMARVFEAVGGEPSHIYRVGYFDIKPGRLSLYKTWDRTDSRIEVGLGTLRYRYYAKATVTNLQLHREALGSRRPSRP